MTIVESGKFGVEMVKELINSEWKNSNSIRFTREDVLDLWLVGFNLNRVNCHDVAFYLNEVYKIFVRSGKLCNHILMDAMNLQDNLGLVQISVNYYNSKEEIYKLISAITNVSLKY